MFSVRDDISHNGGGSGRNNKSTSLPNLDCLLESGSTFSQTPDGNVPEQFTESRDLSGVDPAKPSECKDINFRQMKTALRREKNKFAARDSRKRKQDKSEALWKECLQLESEGTDLRAEVMELSKQKEHLHDSLHTHLAECQFVRQNAIDYKYTLPFQIKDNSSATFTEQYSSSL